MAQAPSRPPHPARPPRGAAAAALFLGLALLRAAPGAAAIVGREPPARILVVEDHSEALCEWYRAGLRGVPLIHVDAHHDFFSPGRRIRHDLEAIRRAFETASCEALRPRVGDLARSDALFHVGDFVYPAFRLGVVSELWWVIPTRRTLPAEEFEAFRAWLQDHWDFPDDFMETLRYDGRVVRGEFQGMPVRLVTLGDLPELGRPALLDIDVDYFVELYDNPVKESMLDLLGWFYQELRRGRIQSDFVTVAASVNGGYTPLRFKYLVDRVRELIAEPDRFAGGPPEAWRLQSRIEYLDFMLARGEALAETRRLAELTPASPVPYYDRAWIWANRADVEQVEVALAQAVARDPSYRMGYVGLGKYLYDTGRPQESFALVREGRARHPDFLPIALALADFHVERGEFAQAVALFRSLLESHAQVPILHAGLAEAYYGLGDTEAARTHTRLYRSLATPGTARDRALERIRKRAEGGKR
ncbi:MAG: hypothetical protein Kow0092_00550 [Deferrisomatales bacterium]